MFHVYREEAFDTLIVNVEIEHEEICMHTGKPSRKSINSHDVLEPFPIILLKNIKSRHAILV